MKLYYSPGACSLSPHIVARESGLDISLQKVDTATKTIAVDGDYWAVNPKGYVPALQLDNGEVLTEGPAIVQYIADQKPEAGLAPRAGTLERYRLQEMLGYINSEIHKSYSPLFNKATPEETANERREYLKKRYAYLEGVLATKQYLVDNKFTAADAYLYTVTRWAPFVNVDLSGFTNLKEFQARVEARPAVQQALKEEGLLK